MADGPDRKIGGSEEPGDAKRGRYGFRSKERTFVGELTYAFRRRVLAGLLVMSPIVISFLPIFIVYPYIKTLADKLQTSRLLGETPSRALVFVAAIVVVFSTLYLFGLLSTTFVVRWTVGLGGKLLAEIPLISFLYRTTKQVADIIVTSQTKPFQKTVMIEYPRKGIYTLGFVTGEGEYHDDKRRLVHVFVPTTPNPTSGFLLLLPAEDVWEADLEIQEAVKFIISGGILDVSDMKLRPYGSPPPESQETDTPD